jgi:hypothetical protein
MSNVSKHYKSKRDRREKLIHEHIHDDGNIIDGFIVDKGHKNGAEVHSITDNGIIIIENYHTGKLITKLIARPHQIIRYYESTGRQPPPEYEQILYLAEWHKSLNYNHV